MIDFLFTIFDLIGAPLAFVIDLMTGWFNQFLPVDLAKTLTVFVIFWLAFALQKHVVQKTPDLRMRLFSFVAIMLFVISGINSSTDHITQDSFWFGDFVELLDKYWFYR
jgi:hypothetical protein